jgi:hypothetical protein
MADKIKDYLHGYRANPKNKYGAKDYMETLPTEYDKYTLSKYVRAMKEGKELGVPQLTPQQLANMALHEGRHDFGFNTMNSENKKAMEIYKALDEKGFGEGAAFAGAIYDKYETAKRLNKPFEEVWNGTGVNTLGQSGADYAKNFKEANYAATNAKNKDLLDYINRNINDKLTPEEKVVNKIREMEDSNVITNGMDPGEWHKYLLNNASPEAKKLLMEANPQMLTDITRNQVRDMYGLNKVDITKPNFYGQHPYDAATNASLVTEFPEIKALINKSVNNAATKLTKEIPQFKIGGKVKLPDGYKHGGSSSLI